MVLSPRHVRFSKDVLWMGFARTTASKAGEYFSFHLDPDREAREEQRNLANRSHVLLALGRAAEQRAWVDAYVDEPSSLLLVKNQCGSSALSSLSQDRQQSCSSETSSAAFTRRPAPKARQPDLQAEKVFDGGGSSALSSLSQDNHLSCASKNPSASRTRRTAPKARQFNPQTEQVLNGGGSQASSSLSQDSQQSCSSETPSASCTRRPAPKARQPGPQAEKLHNTGGSQASSSLSQDSQQSCSSETPSASCTRRPAPKARQPNPEAHKDGLTVSDLPQDAHAQNGTELMLTELMSSGGDLPSADNPESLEGFERSMERGWASAPLSSEPRGRSSEPVGAEVVTRIDDDVLQHSFRSAPSVDSPIAVAASPIDRQRIIPSRPSVALFRPRPHAKSFLRVGSSEVASKLEGHLSQHSG